MERRGIGGGRNGCKPLKARDELPTKRIFSAFVTQLLRRLVRGRECALNADEGPRSDAAAGEEWLVGNAVPRQPSTFQASIAGSGDHRAWNRGQRAGTRHFERYTQESGAEMSAVRYPIVIERTETGFSAYSPDVPGCVAVGDTEDDTRLSFQDALSAHFEAMREIGEPIPQPHTSVDYVEIAA